MSSCQTDLPKGVISSEPNWTALFFIKRPEDVVITFVSKYLCKFVFKIRSHLRWERSVSTAALNSMVWSVGDVVIDELAHLTRKRKILTLFFSPPA